MSPYKGYLKAWNAKITPIFLTVVSTILGFIPFMLGPDKEALVSTGRRYYRRARHVHLGDLPLSASFHIEKTTRTLTPTTQIEIIVSR